MEREVPFNLQNQINNWVTRLREEPSLTASDSEELKSHLLDLMDDLKAAGLDEEESFWIASKRMGTISEWESEYKEANNPIIQLQRSLFILAGILTYFLLYYFIEFSSKLLFIILSLNKIDGYTGIAWMNKYLIGVQLSVIIFIASIYFFEQKTVSFIERIKMQPRHALFMLLATVIFNITNTCLYPVAKNLMGQNIPLRSHFYHIMLYFDYSFPLIICTGFVFLYFRNHRKTNS